MKKIITIKGTHCKACKMMYKDKKIAEKCENWCRKYKSCNTEIIKHAIKM